MPEYYDGFWKGSGSGKANFIYCGHMHAFWLWGKSGGISPPYLAAKSTPGGSGSGQRPFVRYIDESRYFWNSCYQLPDIFIRCKMGNTDFIYRRGNYAVGSGTGVVFCQFEAHPGLFFRVPDRFYPGGDRYAGAARERKCPGGQRFFAPYGESFSV